MDGQRQTRRGSTWWERVIALVVALLASRTVGAALAGAGLSDGVGLAVWVISFVVVFAATLALLARVVKR